MLRINIWLLVLVVLSSCALQMPVSEGLVFKDKDEKLLYDDQPVLPFNFVGGQIVTGSLILPSSGFKDNSFVNFGSDSATVLNDRFLRSTPLPGLLFSFFDFNRVAVGVTPGLVIVGAHLDATVRAVEEIYITANYNLSYNQFELIVQRPLVKKNTGGLSLGLFYRNEQQQYETEFAQFGQREDLFRMRSFGVRAVGQTPRSKFWIFNFRGHINVGYAPDFDASLFTLGLSFSIIQ